MLIKPYFFILLIPLVLSYCSCEKGDSASQENLLQASAPFNPGETITYAVKYLGVKTGTATITFRGIQPYKGKEFYLIVFSAQGPNFFDEEKIYADKETFYPAVVLRDLNIWGKKEKILEEYDQAAGRIKITKTANNKTSGENLQKNSPVDNIYCFIYRSRQSGQFNPGDSFAIHLPTRDIKINLVKRTALKVGGENYQTYFMESDPAKYKVWFETGSRKVPLRINGAMGISDTSMIMTDYKN